MAHRKARGFTILEVMITVAIIAILAAVAIPNYRDYVTRSRIVEATSGLSDARVKMEQYYQDNRNYPTGCTTGNPTATTVAVQTLKSFTITCTNLTNTTYTVTATGISTAGMTGFSYTIDQGNNKTSAFSGAGQSAGWSPATPNNCWVIKKGGVC
jgi:type IV pilus assembly protein PilE